MLSFRQKIFISYVFAFIIFLILLFPLATLLVRRIVTSAMENRSHELIARIKDAPNNESLVRTLKDQKPLLFFRVAVITDDRKVLYDSHTKRLLGPRFTQEFVVDHPEVLEAIDYGKGYHEDWSDLLGQKFAYMAIAFNFHGKQYILRTAFPFRYLNELQSDFELGFLALATAVLLLFSTMSWIIISHFTEPIQRIISAIRPFQEGRTETLPHLEVEGGNSNDEFNKLGITLNSLTEQIQKQINILKLAGNEKQVLLESLQEGVVAVDPKNQVTFINQSALDLLKVDKDHLSSLLIWPTLSELLQMCQSKGKVLTDDIQLEGPRYISLVAAPKQDNTGALLVLQDKTKDFKLVEMKKDFIANASHELKTPITIIRGFAETLHDHPDLPQETTVAITEKIVRNCERMALLIRDLLALADVENLPISRVSEFDLIEVIEKCKQTTLSIFKDATITIHRDAPVYVEADPDLIEMAIINLVNNAAKYSNPPAVVDIYVESTDNLITLKISDKGIGIPEKDLDKIFERFYRIDKAESRKRGGSGLGLSIVHTIMKKHFGNASAESKLGQGSTFTLTLPVKHGISNEQSGTPRAL